MSSCSEQRRSTSQSRMHSDSKPTINRRRCSVHRTSDFDVAVVHLQQEGQHPLTGQRAANFRLLANRIVSRTQASDAMTSRLPRYEAKCVQIVSTVAQPYAKRHLNACIR